MHDAYVGTDNGAASQSETYPINWATARGRLTSSSTPRFAADADREIGLRALPKNSLAGKAFDEDDPELTKEVVGRPLVDQPALGANYDVGAATVAS